MGKGKPKETPAVAVNYTGPIRQLVNRTYTQDVTTVRMSTLYDSQTGGAVGYQGKIQTQQVQDCSDWPNFAASYEEFRVLGFEVTFDPFYPDGNSSVIHSSGLGIQYHAGPDPGPFTSLQSMVQYADHTVFHTGKKWRMEWRMASDEESQFVPTSANVALGGIYVFAPYATSTGRYGFIRANWAVQFRGRR